MDSSNMGMFLLNLRKEKNLTQKDISNICNVSTQAVSKWERGESVPDIEMLEKLSILYNISINELINGEKKAIYIDVNKRKLIISLTFSVLVFMAYLFNFMTLDFQGGTLLLKGFEVIFEATGGFIIILSWTVFLILMSYLILGIFSIVRVIEKKSWLGNYYFISGIVVVIVAIIGLIAGYYVFFPQVIISICTIVVVLMNYEKEAIHSIPDKIALAYKKNVTDRIKEQKEYRENRRNKKKTEIFLYPRELFKRRYVAYCAFFSFMLALLTAVMLTFSYYLIIGIINGVDLEVTLMELIPFIVYLPPTIFAFRTIPYVKTNLLVKRSYVLSFMLGILTIYNMIFVGISGFSFGIMTVTPLLLMLGLLSYARLIIIQTKDQTN